MNEEKSKWLVFKEEDYTLIIPETDISPHGFPKEGEKKTKLAWLDCPCNPKISYEGKIPMIVHNSFEEAKKVEDSMNKITNNK